jgi:pimeloyl-ACP methyl ester carboxylesterase
MRRLRATAPFLDAAGQPVAGSIAETGYRRLGGVDQWVMIRGLRAENPPLVMLHGGPGLSETALFRRFNALLEQHFTVVYWDQRGAGNSFSRSIPPWTMTVDRFLGDLDELVNAIRVRLGHRTVTLFGHSWGSVLGVLYAARCPEKVAAYVGSGQIGDWAASEAASYAIALAEAERAEDEKVLAKLRRIGPPPYSAKAVFTERTCLARLEGQMTIARLWEMARLALSERESSVVGLLDQVRGFRWSMDVLWPEVSRLDLLELVPVLRVPVFLFLGRRDHWVPPGTSVAYYEALAAPMKRLVWFEESGHEPFMDEPDKFNRAMLELVRPVALAASRRDRSAERSESTPGAGRGASRHAASGPA